jgi:DNA repair exonuclease SbcCD ATPase subunit
MSIFNSSELQKSVSEGVSELDGEELDIDLEKDDIKELKRQIHKLNQRSHSQTLQQQIPEVSQESQSPQNQSKLKEQDQGRDVTVEHPPQQQKNNSNNPDIDKIVEENRKLRERVEGLEQELKDVRSMAESASVEEKVDKTQFNNRIEELEERIEASDPELETRLQDIEIEEKVDKSQLEERFEEFKESLESEIGETESRLEEETPDKSEIGSLWASLEMLEDRLDALKDSTPDKNKFEDQVETMDSKVQSIKNEFSGIQSSIEALKSEDNVSEQEFQQQLEDFRRELNEEVSGLNEKLSSQYATSKEVSSLWDALKQLEERQDSSEEVIDQIDEQGVNQFGRLKDTTKYLEHKIQDLEALEDKVSEIDMLKQKLEDVEMVVEGMDQETVGKEEYEEMMQRLVELSELTKTIAERNQ